MIQTDLSSFSYKKGALVPWCKRCGKQWYYRDGTNACGIARLRCRACGYRFLWTSDLPKRRCFSHVMNFAVELYTSLRRAFSLRGIAETLLKVFDVTISYESVRQWILHASTHISRRDTPISIEWHADETYVKINGVGHWLWIVYGRDTKQVLAWHLSKTHLLPDALAVIQQAYDNNKHVRPRTITTDRLWQYPVAIYKIMGWTWKTQKQHHIIDSGIGKNAFIERVNREIKRRLKWFNTFQSHNGAIAFFTLWFHHFNQRPTHVT